MKHNLKRKDAAKYAKRHGYTFDAGRWLPPDAIPAMKAAGRVVPPGSYKLPQAIYGPNIEKAHR